MIESITHLLDKIGILHLLETNQFAVGGLFLGIFGTIIAYLRNVPYRLGIWFMNRFTITFEVYNDKEIYHWIEMWLDTQKFSKKCKRLLVTSSNKTNIDYSNIVFVPSSYGGNHWFRFRWKILIIDRLVDSVSNDDTNNRRTKREGYRITVVFGSRNDMESILKAGHELFDNKGTEKSEIDVYVEDGSGRYWNSIISKPPRPLSSVVLKDGCVEDLVEELDNFIKMEEWYVDQGIPYHKGILLYGPPGNGKTSLILAIASHYKRDIYYLNLASYTYSGNYLAELLCNMDKNSILVLEDADCVSSFGERKLEHNDDKISMLRQIDLASVLNVLDGVLSAHNVIVFMTSNFKDKLDSALIRPGRIDRQIELSNATQKMAEKMYVRFRPTATPSEIEDFGKKHVNKSMAAIQTELLKIGPDIEYLDKNLKSKKDNSCGKRVPEIQDIKLMKNVIKKAKL